MSNTGPEGIVPAAASAAREAGLDPAEARGGEGHEEPTFEAAQQELEQIVQKLESGQAGVEEAIALAERGELLYRLCAARLEAAEGKVEELSRRPAEQ